MSELAATELCASGPGGARTLQVWRTLMSWFAFVFRIFWEIVKGTPSLAQVLSFLGVRHPLLSSSLAFKPLPADAPTDTPPPATAAQSAILGKLMVCGSLYDNLLSFLVVGDLFSVNWSVLRGFVLMRSSRAIKVGLEG